MLSLAILIDQATGAHPASWLHPETNAAASTDIAHYRAIAQLAERGKFDLFFIADTPAARTENLHAWSRFPMFMNVLEPVTLLTALAGATTRIGLGGTVSTSFSEPYNVARQFASLDHISAGARPGTSSPRPTTMPRAISATPTLPPHAAALRAGRRVRRRGARSSGTPGTTTPSSATAAAACYFDPARQHAVHHDGKFFKVDGALNIARSAAGASR